MHYKVQSEAGGVVVFSEIYYPGWTATIDGEEVELGRANYILRALRVPAGTHEVRMEFRPVSVETTDSVAFFAIGCIQGALILAVVVAIRKRRKSRKA